MENKLQVQFMIEALPEGGIVANVTYFDEGAADSLPPILGMTIGGVGRKIASRIVTLWEKRNAESQ